MQVLSRCCGTGRKKAGQDAPPADRTKPNANRPDAAQRSDYVETNAVPKPDVSKVPKGDAMTQPPSIPDAGKESRADEGKEVSEPNLWKQAFQKLDADQQGRLKAMGFDTESGSAKENIKKVQEAVQDKQNKVEEEQWGVSVGGEKIVVREYTQSIIGVLISAGDIVQMVAPPQAAVPWAVLKGLMQMAVVESQQMDALLQVTDRVVRIIHRGMVFESGYLGEDTDHLDATLRKSLASDLTEGYHIALSLLADTHKMLAGSAWKRAFDSIWKQGSVEAGLALIDNQEREMLKNVDALEKQRSKKADERSARADENMTWMLEQMDSCMGRVDIGVQRILQNVETKERQVMLSFISRINFGDLHANVSKTRTPGTGEWLLKHKSFTVWEQASSNIFWLHGTSGTGKSYLTSAVIDRTLGSLRKAPKDEGFAHFYCDRNESGRHEEKHILQSIVRQLSTTSNQPEATQTKLHELYLQCQEQGLSELDSKTCQDQIQASLDAYPATTIVIDALDEIEDDSRFDLIEKLNNFVSGSKNSVRVFVSSRPDITVERNLKFDSSVSIEASDNKGDIQRYLELEISEISRKHNSNILRRFKTKIIDKLLDGCQGMFQWAALQAYQLRKCRSSASVDDQLDNLPKGLENLYKGIWDRIRRTLPNLELMTVERAILWVMAAQRPLTSEQLLSAIRVNTSGESTVQEDVLLNEDDLLDMCNNLLIIDTQQGVWRFSHLSVQEYFEQHMGWTSHQAHLHAATACLTFFITADQQVVSEREQLAYVARQCTLSAMRKEIRAAEKGEASREDIDVMNKKYLAVQYIGPSELLGPEEYAGEDPDRIFDVRHPFHIYARHHIFQHIGIAQRDQDQDSPLALLLKAFLGSPSESSAAYQRWYAQLSENFMRIHPLQFSAAGLDNLGRDMNDLNTSPKGILIPMEPGSVLTFDSVLRPANVAAFAMCRFDLSTILDDWWSPDTMDWQQKNSLGLTPLKVAARAGAIGACNYLFSRAQVDVNLGKPLDEAATLGYEEAVKCLLEIGKAQVDVPSTFGGPGASICAALQKPQAKLAIVKMLRSHGAALCTERYDYVASAARFGKADIVDYLLKEGGSAILSEKAGNFTALGWALLFGYDKIVDRLLEAGADPNAIQPYFGGAESKITPLDVTTYAASDLGHGSRVETLRRSGAVPTEHHQTEGVDIIRTQMKRFASPEEGIRMLQGVTRYYIPKKVGDEDQVPHSRPVTPVE